MAKIIISYVFVANFINIFHGEYIANWSSIDSRPLPKWYDEAKIGIFIHWGVFSVPGMHSEWFWWNWLGDKSPNDVKDYMKNNYPPHFKYPEFAVDFKAQFFDPYKWADLFNKSGANKHHEGYTMWPSKFSWNWNSLDIGPKKDIVALFAKAIKETTGLKFGLYYSLFEWFHPLYLKDRSTNFSTQEYVEQISYPQIMEIVNQYHPEVLWLDGDNGPPEYWKSLDILAWLYNKSPVKSTLVTNDRWGYGCPCHHGGYFTCEDRYIPGKLMPRKWENCMTLDRHSWGHRRNMDLESVLSMNELLEILAETISYGGNLLINVGPTSEGIIVPIFEERLLQLGKWLDVNGEAIYATQPWKSQKEPFQKIWYTLKDMNFGESSLNHYSIYAIFMDWPRPEDGYLLKLTMMDVPFNNAGTTMRLELKLLGYSDAGPKKNIPWRRKTKDNESIFIANLSNVPLVKLPCKHAWVLKFLLYPSPDNDEQLDENDPILTNSI
ncbi:alpha-L-fucosidase-like isoform X2 [Gordionus sp. m RMFG-2023]|uniref:alpha-L-fucosidase-like isoform X2 n=1 Tax=Gordionus sp. m RMFG-2023 TaxID=3053472 RepID=UPI0031FC8A0A